MSPVNWTLLILTKSMVLGNQASRNCPTQALAQPSRADLATYSPGVCLSVRLFVCTAHSLAKPQSNLES